MSKKSFMVLGAGRFGISVAQTLARLGNEVLVIDEDADVIQDISDKVTHAVVGDCCDECVLKTLGVSNFDMVIISLSDNMQASILSTVIIKELNAKYIITTASDKMHMKILEKIGADMVIMPEMEMGEKLAYRITSSKFLDYIELSENFSIAEINCPAKWADKTLKELDIRGKHRINVIAVENDCKMQIISAADYKLNKEDILVIIGANTDIQELKKIK